MWRSATGSVWEGKDFAEMSGMSKPNPVFTLPADAESVERMVEQINHGIVSLSDGRDHYTSRDIARAALAAIGVKAKGKK